MTTPNNALKAMSRKYKARIVLARTGTAVDYESESYGADNDELYYYWTDGNFGCDCNRGTSFRRALYPVPPADDPFWNNHAARCGFGPNYRYRVPYLEFEDGSRLTIDGDAT